MIRTPSLLQRNHHYLQIALNSTLEDAERIIMSLPGSERILIEAGTPLIKQYGIDVIRKLKFLYSTKSLFSGQVPYIVADLKCMDRGEHEASMAARAGASAAIVLGQAPVATIDVFIKTCSESGLDSYVDMMNIDKPYQLLRRLKALPTVVLLHRVVDEEKFSDAPLPIHLINKIKGTFNVKIAIAGGDTPRELQSSIFNGADIVVLWKDFYTSEGDTAEIAEELLRISK